LQGFSFSEYYSKDLSKKIKSAKQILMRRGEHIVGGAIYGYRKNNGKWEHDPPAAEVVREIFDMALDGKTTAQIRDKLFADCQPAPREYEYLNKGKEVIPKCMWPTSQLFRILNNEQYTGTYIAGKHETAHVGLGRQIEKDRSEWIIIPDSHPPIVSKEDFARVQDILKSPKEALSNDRERSKHAKKLYDKISSGGRKSSAAPYGYTRNSKKDWEIDEAAASVVREIFDLALQGLTVRDITERIESAGHPAPKEHFRITKGHKVQPAGRWPLLRIRQILQNEQYTGTYLAGRTFQDEAGRKYYTRNRIPRRIKRGEPIKRRITP
jgi:DNA invertase Pin-like site-specific DNA recombinase